MKLYRFSPVTIEEELREAITHIHRECHKLCQQAFGYHLPVAGNVGIFAHYEDEYRNLVSIQEEITSKENPFNDKYFRLLRPIHIEEKDGIPAAEYTHLYIRKPDPYRHHVGDIDFYMEEGAYKTLRGEMLGGKQLDCARIYPGDTHNMIELFHPDSDVLGYVNYKMMKEY